MYARKATGDQAESFGMTPGPGQKSFYFCLICIDLFLKLEIK
jgi:hypothetical protein